MLNYRRLQLDTMKNKASLTPFLILGLVTVLGCGRLTQEASNERPGTGTDGPNAGDVRSNEFTLAGKEWKSLHLDKADIKVDLPGHPIDKSPQPSQLPPGTAEVFRSMRIYAYDEKDFASSYSQLVPTGGRAFEIKELADTSMGALRKQAPDLSYTLDVKSPANAKYNGTFTRNGKAYELKGCVIYQRGNPTSVWSVITVYPTDSADGREASRRIIQSVVFKDSPEDCK